jgi:GNAT superfamily N-acetyltransferase
MAKARRRSQPDGGIEITLATEADAESIVALKTAVAQHLTAEFNQGHWSSNVTERGVLHTLRTSRVFVVRREFGVVAMVRLATKKPWAIDKSYFKHCRRPIYLTDMAVAPELQRRGMGRAILAQAKEIVRDWPGDAIRLDAYDSPGGAGPFYAKCGFTEVGRVVYRKTPLIYYELLL